jgi:hypothetical protein
MAQQKLVEKILPLLAELLVFEFRLVAQYLCFLDLTIAVSVPLVLLSV